MQEAPSIRASKSRGCTLTVATRALISCYAVTVARAQHLGRKSPFCAAAATRLVARSARRDFDAQHFSTQAQKKIARLFFAVGDKNIGTIFYTSPEAFTKKKVIYVYV